MSQSRCIAVVSGGLSFEREVSLKSGRRVGDCRRSSNPACYRASWQLPGRDSHPLATTSLRWISYSISTPNSGRTRGK